MYPTKALWRNVGTFIMLKSGIFSKDTKCLYLRYNDTGIAHRHQKCLKVRWRMSTTAVRTTTTIRKLLSSISQLLK
jgi:hypothetical protein